MMKSTILVVEDEPDIASLIAYNLTQAGFAVEEVRDGLEAWARIGRSRPDLVLLDLMLPGMDGKEICRRLRADPDLSHLPVIMLTARSDEIDRVIGFELGADDYITKPFSPRELVLRIRSVLRRTQGETDTRRQIGFSDLLIDLERHRVEVQGREIGLTATEFKLLTHLASRSGRVLTREVLLHDVWGDPDEGYPRTVDTHVRRLRQKLGPARDRIETIRGLGYRFRDQD